MSPHEVVFNWDVVDSCTQQLWMFPHGVLPCCDGSCNPQQHTKLILETVFPYCKYHIPSWLWRLSPHTANTTCQVDCGDCLPILQILHAKLTVSTSPYHTCHIPSRLWLSSHSIHAANQVDCDCLPIPYMRHTKSTVTVSPHHTWGIPSRLWLSSHTIHAAYQVDCDCLSIPCIQHTKMAMTGSPYYTAELRPPNSENNVLTHVIYQVLCDWLTIPYMPHTKLTVTVSPYCPYNISNHMWLYPHTTHPTNQVDYFCLLHTCPLYTQNFPDWLAIQDQRQYFHILSCFVSDSDNIFS